MDKHNLTKITTTNISGFNCSKHYTDQNEQKNVFYQKSLQHNLWCMYASAENRPFSVAALQKMMSRPVCKSSNGKRVTSITSSEVQKCRPWRAGHEMARPTANVAASTWVRLGTMVLLWIKFSSLFLQNNLFLDILTERAVIIDAKAFTCECMRVIFYLFTLYCFADLLPWWILKRYCWLSLLVYMLLLVMMCEQRYYLA